WNGGYRGSCLRNLQVLDGVHLKRWSMLPKNGGLQKYRQMFGGIVATGENVWAPLSGVLPSGVLMGDDALNEGFGDSDEHSNENEGIPPDEVPSNPSHEILNRRKQTVRVVHVKEKKSSSSRKLSRNILTTQLEKLCENMASPRKSVNEIIFPHSQYTFSNAMDALRTLGDEISKKR
ncbi:hypothetical protein Gotur_024729, partial [Gossypium turneri]